jgi:hypothetical protein
VTAEDLYQRFVLYIVVVLQVTLIPIVGFSLTYLLEVDQDNFSIAVRTELIYWIVVAGLLYGLLSLLLALFFGGYKPTSVADKGGWMPPPSPMRSARTPRHVRPSGRCRGQRWSPTPVPRAGSPSSEYASGSGSGVPHP